MFEQYEKDFLFRVRLPNGTFVYRLEEEEARAVEEAIRRRQPLPPPTCQRLLPFGEGIEIVGDKIICRYKGALLGVFRDLRRALTKWDAAERYERFSLEKDEELQAIDERYYANLTYDEDGYKVFTPQPLIP